MTFQITIYNTAKRKCIEKTEYINNVNNNTQFVIKVNMKLNFLTNKSLDNKFDENVYRKINVTIHSNTVTSSKAKKLQHSYNILIHRLFSVLRGPKDG